MVDSDRSMKTAYTYESWAFVGHSMHLCSIRRTHYCSLENNISTRINVKDNICTVEEIYIQPDRHEPDSRALVGAKHTERRHTRLHEGSISVGASVAGGGGPGRKRRACRDERRRQSVREDGRWTSE